MKTGLPRGLGRLNAEESFQGGVFSASRSDSGMDEGLKQVSMQRLGTQAFEIMSPGRLSIHSAESKLARFSQCLPAGTQPLET